MSDLESYNFRRQLESIKEKEGRGTELISLYIPHDRPISDVASYLRDEYGSAANIKSKQTRSNVQGAIDSIMARLKMYKQAPVNGIAIFCGALPIGGDRYQIESTVVEPPQPITSFSYRCGSGFVLDKLEKMMGAKRVYGLVVVDWAGSAVAILRGTGIEVKEVRESRIPRKQGRGGQSQHRFQENHRLAVLDHYKRTGEMCDRAFLSENVEGIIVGGTATKEDFIRGDFLHHELRNKVIGAFDIGYTDESGFKELIDRAGDLLADLDIVKEKKLVEGFMVALVNNRAAYGLASVERNLEMGAVDTLLVSEGFPDGEKARLFAAKAVDTGATVEFISTESEEGERILKVFGGIVAILRYNSGV